MARSTLKLSLLAASVGLALAAQAQAADALSGQRDAIARLAVQTGNTAQVSIHGATGSASFVRVAPGSRLAAQPMARSSNDAARQTSASQFLNNYGSLFGITDAATELTAGVVSRDRQGGTHISQKQVYKGIPVYGAELKSHFDAAGNLVAVNGVFVPGIDLDTTPGRTAAQAAESALARVRADLGRTPKAKLTTKEPQLLVYRDGLVKGVEGRNRLAYLVEVGNRVDVREFVIVDAQSGKVVEKFTGIHDALKRRAFDGAGATQPGPNYPNTPFWVEGQAFPTGTTEADNMLLASLETYNLFKTAFGRDSFDANGATMDSIFNRGDSCPNASWNGIYISFCPGVTTDDVTGHEWAHAYTEYTHNLIYAWQPGALNEAYSDIWGETVDRINGRGGDTPDAARTVGACAASTTAPPSITITAPASIAGTKSAGTGAFGPANFIVPATDVVVVNDGDTTAGSTTIDGCTAPFVNAAAIAGKIAFIDRGVCTFTTKVKNAQLAGAIGVIIGDNAGGDAVLGMGGTDATITIPALRISQNNGTAIKAAVGVKASMQAGPGSDNSVRWLMGEDSSSFGGAIRDMYNPTCFGDPGKVSDTEYRCSTGDNGGVHSNSGVPNHGYALLVDGGNYNGQNISAIGLTKAAHIYYRAQSVYQNLISGFPEHADAIEQSCADLTGVNLTDLSTGQPSGQIITANDCAQVAKAALAVELRKAPTQCGFTTMLAQNPPALCSSGAAKFIAGDNFEGGKRGSLNWLKTYQGVSAQFIPRNFAQVNSLPSGKVGSGMYAADISAGVCDGGPGTQAGVQRLESPEITIPAGSTNLRMSFDHWVSTETGWDGGNVKISVNGGAYQLVRSADFIYNPYNTTLNITDNDNPLAGQPAFSGADGGKVTGTWGRSIVNLKPYAVPGDKVKLRFELGNDCAGGGLGWYLDDIQVYSCTAP